MENNARCSRWIAPLFWFLLKSSIVLSSEVSEVSRVNDSNSGEAPIVPVLLDLPTIATPKPEADGSSIQTLQYVAIVARHGDRYKQKDEIFENDPFALEDPFWMPHGHGQLRNKGKFRMHHLGQYFRMRYNGFIKEEYYYGNVKFYSPDIDRCLMSAQLISQGLFPPTGVNIWNDNVGKFFQPIPIKSFDPSQDIIFNDGKACPPYEKELKKVLHQELKEINDRYKDIYDYVAYHTGKNITNLEHINEIYQALRIESENGRLIPDWTKKVFPSKLKALAGLYNQVIYYNDKMKRIKAGPIFNEILSDLSSKTSHLVDRRLKMKIWTGHDSTLLKILHTLKFSEKYGIPQLESVMLENPDPMEASKTLPSDDTIMETQYGAALMVELHYINRKYYVKVLYLENGFCRAPKNLKLKDCGENTLIPYEKFASIYNKYAISDAEWNKKCGVVTC